MKNPMLGVKVEYHILQSFPVSCLNRDDVGSPKSAVIGGVMRARVSSQCWKRQVRMQLRELGVSLGVRTKLIHRLIEDACLEAGADAEAARRCGEAVERLFIKEEQKAPEPEEDAEADTEAQTDTLLFMTRTEARKLADEFKKVGFDPARWFGMADDGNSDKKKTDKKKADKNAIKKIAEVLGREMDYAVDGLDIALFGRMVAQAPSLNVEAAVSFSHAISTHRVVSEVDFFTALDDLGEEPGAAHMGSLEFNSATYYRYVGLDLGQLYESLAGQNLPQAVVSFTKALFLAVPPARQATQSAACPWQFARVLVRRGQRIQAPFETPVKARDGGFLEPSKEELKSFLDRQERLWGPLFGKIGSFDYGEDESKGFEAMVKFLEGQVRSLGG